MFILFVYFFLHTHKYISYVTPDAMMMEKQSKEMDSLKRTIESQNQEMEVQRKRIDSLEGKDTGRDAGLGNICTCISKFNQQLVCACDVCLCVSVPMYIFVYVHVCLYYLMS